MRVLLVQVDRKMLNLALMKLSAFHKKHGDVVGFHIDRLSTITRSSVQLQMISVLKASLSRNRIELSHVTILFSHKS